MVHFSSLFLDGNYPCLRSSSNAAHPFPSHCPSHLHTCSCHRTSMYRRSRTDLGKGVVSTHAQLIVGYMHSGNVQEGKLCRPAVSEDGGSRWQRPHRRHRRQWRDQIGGSNKRQVGILFFQTKCSARRKKFNSSFCLDKTGFLDQLAN